MYLASDPASWFEIADQMRLCAETFIEVPVLRSCTITGEIAWDDCECGQLVVSLGTTFPYTTFPNPGVSDGSMTPCGAPTWATEYTVSILRCSPETETDAPPSCEALGAAARLSAADAAEVNNALRCCLRDLKRSRDINDFQIGITTFVGGEGMCQGSNTLVTVGLLGGCPCDDDGAS